MVATTLECTQEEIQSMLNGEQFRFRRVLLLDVSGTEKGWRAETCKKAKPVSEDRALQNWRHSHVEKTAKSRRLDGQDRLEGCYMILICLRILLLPMERQTYNFNCLSFGPSSTLWIFTKTMRPTLQSVRESWFCDQPPQAGANPDPGNRIPRIHSQLHTDGNQVTRRCEARKALQAHRVSALTLN